MAQPFQGKVPALPLSSADPQALSCLRDRAWLAGAYLADGRSRREIAADLGVAGSTVGEWLARHGIAVPTAVAARRARFDADRPDELDDAG